MALVELSVVEQRYRAVLAVLAGATVTEVAAQLGVSRQTLHTWKLRYAESGLAGLELVAVYTGGGNPMARPIWRSPAWSPIGRPAADRRSADRPGQHAPTSIAYQLVRTDGPPGSGSVVGVES